MTDPQKPVRALAKAGTLCLILAFGLGALTACDTLLEVDLPAQLTDEAIEDPEAAETLVNSVIGMFECAYSSLNLQVIAYEDVWEKISGMSPPMSYQTRPSGFGDDPRPCDTVEQSADWYANVQTSRAFGENIYDKLENDWTVSQVPDKVKFQAILALYIAADFNILGDYFCEMAVDGGELMSPDQTLVLGEQWIQTALGHITAGGNFALPHGIASSAETMAYALRARMRWARGDFTGALDDANRVPMDFSAWVTRSVGIQRRNKLATAAFILPFGGMNDVIDWWDGSTFLPNPATGQQYAVPIPFTGYLNLGLLPDGRAIRDDGIPIRTSVEATAVQDTRVTHVLKETSAALQGEAQMKYQKEDDPHPLVSGREMWLIRAEIEGGQTAIDLVNDLRDFHNLPRVTYADPADANQIRFMVLEEKRRELWLEGGRWWATKLANLDLMWFPRDQGEHPSRSFRLQGGVRMAMPTEEFDFNLNLTLADEATLCPVAERPINPS